MLAKFSEKAQKSIVIAESIAFDLGHPNVGTEHLLLSLLKIKESKIRILLEEKDVTYEKIYDDLIYLFGKKDIQPFYMEYTNVMKRLIESSIIETKRNGQEKVTLEMLSFCLFQIEDCVAMELLRKYQIDILDIRSRLKVDIKRSSELDSIEDLTNVNKKVAKLQTKVIGREKEIQQLIHILSRKEKSNALIIGETGVGKTALVEKLAILINDHQVPEHLQDKVIYELDLASVIAGTKYRGEFEDKLKKIVRKFKDDKNAILFIDEIHNMIGAGGAEGAIDAANILKPYLARKELVCIGATTFDEYYKHFEKDRALDRRFQIVQVEETSKEETLKILDGLVESYRLFHNLTIGFQQLKLIIDLADTYVKDKHFPDKGIDILDYACVKSKLLQKESLSDDIIYDVVEEMSKMKIIKENKIENLYKALNENIMGQEAAISQTIAQIKCIESGLIDENKPLSIMMYVGATGVGKTEMAKLIAKHYFGNQDRLIKIDMSEFMDSASVTKLLGAPPGYVGHNTQSNIVERIRKTPHCVVLLDEIEKANKDVLNVFLQVFDEGYFIDGHKTKVDFRNSIIILTSNLGYTSNIFSKELIGFSNNNKSNDELMMEIEKRFNPEFINRIDDIIFFNRLNQETYQELTKLYLDRINGKMAVPFVISEEMISKVIRDSDIEKYGVRSLQRTIKKVLLDEVNKSPII